MQLPHSIEVEQALLSLFISNSKSSYAIEKVKIEDFYNKHNQVLFQAVYQLHEEKKTIDLNTVFEQAKKIGNTDINYISELVTRIAIYDTLENYIEILKEKSVLRSIIEKCNQTLVKAYDDKSDPMELKTSLAQSLDEITFKKSEGGHHIKEIFYNILDQIQNYDEVAATKYLTGFSEIDKRTNGLHKEEVTVIAARPSVGKTALALQIGRNLAKNGLRTYVLSREMSEEQMGKRLLTAYGISGAGLKTNKLSDAEQASMIKIMSNLSNLDFFIDTESKNIADIKQKIREYKPEVLIIDYLQLLEPSNSNAPREQQVSKLSRDIKNISMDFKIPVVVLSQMNRQTVARRPTLADLRESGAIEQDANNVWFIHLPQEEELKEICEHKDSPITVPILKKIKEIGARLVEIIIAKQRDGETDSFYALYIPQKLQFVPLNFRRD